MVIPSIPAAPHRHLCALLLASPNDGDHRGGAGDVAVPRTVAPASGASLCSTILTRISHRDDETMAITMIRSMIADGIVNIKPDPFFFKHKLTIPQGRATYGSITARSK